MNNDEAKKQAAELTRKLYNLAKAKGRDNRYLTFAAATGGCRLVEIADAAKAVGYWLVIESPEERGKWYNASGQWKELLKRLVFHWYERRNQWLVANGRSEETDNLYVMNTPLRRELEAQGLSPVTFGQWLNRKVKPSFASFCLLATFEGFRVDWREIPEGETE